MSSLNLMLSWVKHEINLCTLGPVLFDDKSGDGPLII